MLLRNASQALRPGRGFLHADTLRALPALMRASMRVLVVHLTNGAQALDQALSINDRHAVQMVRPGAGPKDPLIQSCNMHALHIAASSLGLHRLTRACCGPCCRH